MFKTLYLPELDAVHVQFCRAQLQIVDWFIKCGAILAEQELEGRPTPGVSMEDLRDAEELLKVLRKTKVAVENEAMEIGRAINA